MNNALKQSFMVLFILTILCLTVMSVSASEVTNNTLLLNDNNTITTSNPSITNLNESDNIDTNHILTSSNEDSYKLYSTNTVNKLGNTVSGNNFNDISSAINSAGYNETIYLGNTTYTGSSQIIVGQTVIIDGANDAITSAEGRTSVLDAKQVSGILQIKADNVILKNIILVNANSMFTALYWRGSNGNIINCTFINNTGSNLGGAVVWIGKSGTVTNCTFINNKDINGQGGAIFWYSATNAKVINSTFINNSAKNGGAISWTGANGLIFNSTFKNNSATENGGALSWSGANGLIFNSTFKNNSATENGGAIDWTGTDGNISNSTFKNNSVTGNGGAINWNNANGNLSNSTFINNSAILHGGAIYWNGTSGNILNSSFNNNKVPYSSGGAIDWTGADGVINNSTFDNNSAFAGPGIHWEGTNGKVIGSTFTNNINTMANGLGGGICWSGSKGLIYNSSFYKNYGGGHGGGVYILGEAYVNYCTFINNTANIGGGLRCNINSYGIIINNSYFANNSATKHGGGICSESNKNVTMENIQVLNCTAPYSGGIHAHNTVILKNVTVSGCNATTLSISGTEQGYGGGISLLGNNNHFINVTVKDCNAVEYGGGIEIKGLNSLIENTTVNNCTAPNGGGIHIRGANTDILNSNITNCTSTINGAGIWIEGNNALVNKTIVSNCNTTEGSGAGIYILGNNASIINSKLIENDANVEGGGAYIEGSDATVNNCTFLKNHAIPDELGIVNGLGGAIYVKGDNTDILNSYFNLNTARNGSAIYTDGKNCNISNTTFDQNQAWSYVIDLNANLSYTYYPSIVNVSGTLVGGNNIANAIYNTAGIDDITFNNVTYEAFINGVYKNLTTKNDVHPVLGAINSDGGNLLYQDDHENNQLVNLTIIDKKGNIIYTNSSIRTDVYGDFNILFENLKPGYYNAYSQHDEDNYYKPILNSTNFIIDSNITANKTVNNTHCSYNDIISWNITIWNHNNVTAYDVNVTDFLPEGLIFIGYTASQGTYDNNTGLWKIGDINPNTIHNLTINTRVNVSNTTLTNHYSVSGENLFHTVSGSNMTFVRVITNIIVNKTVNNTNPNYLENITWTINVKNLGPDNATNVKVTELLPDGLTYIKHTTNNGTYNSSTGIWNIGNVNVDETATLIIITQVSNDSHNITNTVNVTSTEKDWNLTNNVYNLTIVPNSADLSIIKTVSNTNPYIGDTITWTITVTNNGPDNATLVKVTDILPKGLTYVNSTSNRGTYDNNTGTWTIGDLQNGQTVNLKILTRISSLSSIINIVNITGAERDWDISNNNANSTETGINRPIPPVETVDLTVNKTVNSSHIIKGDTISWIITVYNNGTNTATNVKVIDLLPEELVYINSTSNKGSYNSTNGVWTISNLNPKESVSLTIITLTVDSGFITNNVNVSSTEKDINQTNNKANITILVHPVVDLTVNKTVNSSHIIKGDTISWIITISNNGPDPATNVKVIDLLPEGLIYINSLADKGTYNSNNGIWTVGELNVNETVSLTIITKTVEAGFITNNVNVTGEEKDLNSSNNEANLTITVHPIIDLTGNKTVNNTNPKYGDTIDWIITIWNNGPDPATNVMVSDLLPEGLIYLNSNASKGAYNPNTSVWTIGDLNLGETVTLHIITKVNVSNTTLINSVNITGEEKDWNLSNNYLSANITIPVNNNAPGNETPGNDTPSNPISPSNPNNPNISTSNPNLTSSKSNEGSLASNGISMKSTGNPILVLLLILVVLGGIIPYRKQK